VGEARDILDLDTHTHADTDTDTHTDTDTQSLYLSLSHTNTLKTSLSCVCITAFKRCQHMINHSSTDADLSEVQSLEFGLGGHVRLEVGCKKNKFRHSSMLCICERVVGE